MAASSVIDNCNLPDHKDILGIIMHDLKHNPGLKEKVLYYMQCLAKSRDPTTANDFACARDLQEKDVIAAWTQSYKTTESSENSSSSVKGNSYAFPINVFEKIFMSGSTETRFPGSSVEIQNMSTETKNDRPLVSKDIDTKNVPSENEDGVDTKLESSTLKEAQSTVTLEKEGGYFEKLIDDFGFWHLKKMNELYETCANYNMINLFLLGLLHNSQLSLIRTTTLFEYQDILNSSIIKIWTTDRWSEVFEQEQNLNIWMQKTTDTTVLRRLLSLRQHLRMSLHNIYIVTKQYIDEAENKFKMQK